MKIDDGCWFPIEGNPISRGKSEVLWRIPVYPCQSHQVRLSLEKEDCVEYLYHEKNIGPFSSEEMETSGYRPESPTDLQVYNLPGKNMCKKSR